MVVLITTILYYFTVLAQMDIKEMILIRISTLTVTNLFIMLPLVLVLVTEFNKLSSPRVKLQPLLTSTIAINFLKAMSLTLPK